MKKKLQLAFILPINQCSGGTFVVYTHASALQAAGHDVTIIFKKYENKIGFKHFMDCDLKFLIFTEISQQTNFDIVIATWWETFFLLPHVSAKKHFYYVQSDERRFYPKNVILRDWVEVTYSFPEIGIVTAARWIKNSLEDEFKLHVAYAPNGVDSNQFSPDIIPLASKSNKLRVLIQGPGGVEFKRVDDAFAITRAFSNIEVWYVCSDGIVKSKWKYDRLIKNISFSEMPAIYKSCDILIKVSAVEGFFGPPLEMMATGGTCIVSNVSGYDEYVRHEYNALVIPIGDIAAGIQALQRLQNDPGLLQRLKQNSLITAHEFDWSLQFPKFERALLELDDNKKEISLESRKKIMLLGDLQKKTTAIRYKIVDRIANILSRWLPRWFLDFCR